MTTAEKLYQLIPTLTDTQLNEVLDFAEFLHQKQSSQQTSANPTQKHQTTQLADAVQTMRGFLTTDQPAPTDKEVALMLEERREEKYR